jgi:hypothetical protein
LIARHGWLTPLILATQEAEIRRITVGSQSWANSSLEFISKKPITKKDGGVSQGLDPEFKPQYHTQNN